MGIMKAVRIHAYGGQEALVVEDVPCPEPGENELLVRVYAAGVNPIDWKIRNGWLAGLITHKLPLTLGWDLSGVVEAAGPGATNFSPGDEVIGRANVALDGTYAEYAVVKVSETAPKPKSIDHVHAAAIPNSALAAWNALFTVADLRPNQSVLIHAAGGGVGTFAVQLAKNHGAYVYGTASNHNLNLLTELGVDRVIDYTTTRFETVVDNVDVVLDNVGGETLQRSWGLLRPGGILVSVVEFPSHEKAQESGVRASFASAEMDSNILTKIAAKVDEGSIRPVVSAVFPLDRVREAHALSESNHAQGKIVLSIVS